MSRHTHFARLRPIWMLLAVGMASSMLVTVDTQAEESLLWKAISTTPAVVVPTYAGQGSPFPKTELPAVASSNTEILDEQARLREQAYNNAHNLLKSGNALVPDLRTISVGGVVEGNLGARVLINNQWLGVGGKIMARQYKTAAALEALKALTELDAAAGEDINQALNLELSQNPTVALTLRKITSNTLILGGPRGDTKININMNSK